MASDRRTATGPGRPAPTVPATRATPVYVLGPTARGPRLYREFRPGAASDPVRAAVAGLGAPPADPDYRSPWLEVPARVAPSRLTVSGTASVFEATVVVEVRRGSAVLARNTATASVGAPRRGDWRATLSVPSGDYVLTASEPSQQDGSAVATDTKRITVR
jgi:hypothetical protein